MYSMVTRVNNAVLYTWKLLWEQTLTVTKSGNYVM